jgi:hypothetical protein
MLAIAVGALLALGCRSKSAPAPLATPSASAAPDPKLVDRLAPGELEPGKSQVFGFEVPRNMDVKGAFLEVAYLEGPVTPEALANYVRERVEVDRVEIGAASTLFPRAHIKRGAPERIYDLVVAPGSGPLTELTIRDVTPPRPSPPGMTDAERWRQAGRKPDGTPLDGVDFK